MSTTAKRAATGAVASIVGVLAAFVVAASSSMRADVASARIELTSNRRCRSGTSRGSQHGSSGTAAIIPDVVLVQDREVRSGDQVVLMDYRHSLHRDHGERQHDRYAVNRARRTATRKAR
jgi:hypothetical protein